MDARFWLLFIYIHFVQPGWILARGSKHTGQTGMDVGAGEVKYSLRHPLLCGFRKIKAILHSSEILVKRELKWVVEKQSLPLHAHYRVAFQWKSLSSTFRNIGQMGMDVGAGEVKYTPAHPLSCGFRKEKDILHGSEIFVNLKMMGKWSSLISEVIFTHFQISKIQFPISKKWSDCGG